MTDRSDQELIFPGAIIGLHGVKTDIFSFAIFPLIEPRSKWFIDIGASNGVDYDPTYCLSKDKWSGISFEATEDKYKELCKLHSGIIKINDFVTPDNIIKHLQENNVPKNIDAVSIDIDGYDYFVIKELLENGYEATCFCVECNTIFPPGINFTVLYKEKYFWNVSHFLGCSFSLYDKLFKKYGYEPVIYDWENAYYVKKENRSKFSIKDNSLMKLWKDGYWNRLDRQVVGVEGGFEWNLDFEITDLSNEEQLKFIRIHPHFRRRVENEEYVLFYDDQLNVLDKNKKLLGLGD
jgi:hypothetical protein